PIPDFDKNMISFPTGSCEWKRRINVIGGTAACSLSYNGQDS
ncbi:MAG: hypothetical protein K0R47_5149, partial [Brevibacillus sp.]|nr:hypothetical protein [Brevibacillus sp.]